MRLTIETYWKKVIRDPSQPFGSRVLEEYECKDKVSYPRSGWDSIQEWRAAVKHKKGFLGFDEKGRAKFDLGRSYGIHSFQLVGLED